MALFGAKRAKGSLVIEKDNLRTPKRENQVGSMIAVDVKKFQCDNYQIGTGAIELWSQKDAGMGGVPARKLDHLQVPVEIKRQKMAGDAAHLLITHKCVRLE